MPSIEIYASKSLTVLSTSAKKNIRSNIITIGKMKKYDYISYLYFQLPIDLAYMEVCSAEMVLFKTGNLLYVSDNYYWVCPLLEDFGKYTNYNNRPNYESSLGVSFSICKDEIYSQIDITQIVNQWMNNNLSNKGLAIFADSYSEKVITYGSAINNDKYLIPFLRIHFRNKLNNYCIKTVPISCEYSILPDINKKNS